MRVLSNGNIGIGTAAPVSLLHLWGNSPEGVEMRLSGDVESPSTIRFTGGGGNVTEGFVMSYTNGGDTYFDNVYVNPIQSNPAIRFRTNTFGSPIDALTITYNGYVGINTTAPAYTLDVNGSTACTLNMWTSDIRKKKNISPLALNGLDIVNLLNPVSFEWKEAKDEGMKGIQMGFVAQELEKIIPSMVLTASDSIGSKRVKYNELFPILVKAIQEQQKIIDRQQTALSNIESENKKLKISTESDIKNLESEIIKLKTIVEKLNKTPSYGK